MIRLKVSGMTCEHCTKAVREALSSVTGVDQVTEVSLERGEAVLEGSPQTEALVAALHEEGYEAQPA